MKNNEKVQLLKNLIKISESKHFGTLNETLLSNIEKNVFYKNLTEDDIIDVYAKLGEMTNEEIAQFNRINRDKLTESDEKLLDKINKSFKEEQDDDIEDDEVEQVLLKEFEEFINEFEFEEILDEEKLSREERIANHKWKLILFSLRFLKEKSITDILKAYYSDSEGNETDETIRLKDLSKKEKLNMLRALVDRRIVGDERQKILNNTAVNAIGKAGTNDITQGAATMAGSGAGMIATGAGAAGVANAASMGATIATTAAEGTAATAMALSGMLAPVVGVIFPIIWAVLIGGAVAGGIGALRGLRKMQKATVMRRDEILAELKNKKVNVNFKESLEKIADVKSTQLSEAVTFIDNAGKIKTTTADEYNKSMHEYDTDTEIEHVNKRLKRKEALKEETELTEGYKSRVRQLEKLNTEVNKLARAKDEIDEEEFKKLQAKRNKKREQVLDDRMARISSQTGKDVPIRKGEEILKKQGLQNRRVELERRAYEERKELGAPSDSTVQKLVNVKNNLSRLNSEDK